MCNVSVLAIFSPPALLYVLYHVLYTYLTQDIKVIDNNTP
jgi:hypothetical protein